MEKNVGGIDRAVRTVVALALLAIAVAYPRLRDARGRRVRIERKVLIYGAFDLLVTSLLRRCPVNYALGIDTCPSAGGESGTERPDVQSNA